MLFDLIRDFFVQHIFGGHVSYGDEFAGFLGPATYYENGEYLDRYDVFTSDYDVMLGDTSFAIGDYLSTIATFITISIIVVLCALFVYRIIKLIGGLIR